MQRLIKSVTGTEPTLSLYSFVAETDTASIRG